MKLLIAGGRILDPSSKRDGIFDLLIENGRVARIAKKISEPGVETFNAKNCWVMPGLVDAHVHLREPGAEASETIETGTRSAAAGGVTTLLAMANTQPPTDTPDKISWTIRRVKETACVKVHPVGAVTRNLEGHELTDIEGLVRAGAKAISDDGRCVMNSQLLRKALEASKKAKAVLIEHSEDENLSRGGVMNEGPAARKLNAGCIPSESESVMVARNIFLARLTGTPIHLAHVSNADSVELVRWAKQRKISITAETCPHYFALTDEAVAKHGTHAKMKPPLRTRKDSDAIKQGLKDGTIDIIATDHAPHSAELKNRTLDQAPFGIIGMPTLFALIYNELVLNKILAPLKAVEKVTAAPAKIFGLEAGSLKFGAAADIAIFDPSKKWKPSAEDFRSKSANSPFIGRNFEGRIAATFVDGKKVFSI